MRCASCRHPNRTGARFCEACGAALEIACAACGTALRPAARFCDHCGAPVDGAATASRTAEHPRAPLDYTPRHLAERILTSRAALVGERKQVTVLFADIQGSVALSERLDPEDWHHVLDGLFEILTDGVHRFDGTVNQFTGDGVMALFGAPLALEDHAQRACHAALHLADALGEHARRLRAERGIDLRVRLALNSGDVVVGAIGDDLRMDYTAQGATVGLAARLQQVAAPGRVLVSEHTAALVRGWFALHEQGTHRFAGIAAPVRAYELARPSAARTRLEAAGERGLSPFVGRTQELGMLERALARAAAGEAQVVGVVGEAGVGKSRLCLELARRAREGGLAVYAAGCPPHATALPLFLVRELVRSLLGLEPGCEPGPDTGSSVAARLRALDPALEEHAGLLLELLELPDPTRPGPRAEAEVRRRLRIDVIRGVLVACAAAEPALLVLDDLHWIDAASDALLAEVLEGISDARLVVLANFRPEYQPPWTRRSHYQQIGLGALARERAAELAGALLGSDPSLADLALRLYDTTRGNPFFVEEIVRGLLERGALAGESGQLKLVDPGAALGLPATVQNVLAARIDRLPEAVRAALHAAAVVGRPVSAHLLARITGGPEAELAAALDTLCGSELMRCVRTAPRREYGVRHPLVREVALESQLRTHRRALHGAVAWILALDPAARTEEGAALVSHHLEQAGELLEAARWRWRAVEAIGWTDAQAIVPHLREAIRLTDGLPDDPGAARLGLWARVRLVADALLSRLPIDAVERLVEDTRTVGERLGHLPALAALQGWYANVLEDHQRFDEAAAAATEARELARKSGSPRALLQISYGVLRTLFEAGRLDEAIEFADEVLAATPGPLAGADAVVAAHAGWLRADMLSHAGHLHEALAACDATQAMSEAAYHPQVGVGLAMCRAQIYYFLGEPEEQLAAAREAVASADAWRTPIYRDMARRWLAAACIEAGRPDEALETLDEIDRIVPETSWPWSAMRELLRARALLDRGDPDAARPLLEHAFVELSRPVRFESLLWSRWRLADGFARLDAHAHRERIEALLAEAEARRLDFGAESWVPVLTRTRAELAELLGDEPHAREEWARTAQQFRTLHAPRAAERAEARRAELTRGTVLLP